ncbi:MAG: FAD-binding oxidoreductase [Alsobacter sp.]
MSAPIDHPTLAELASGRTRPGQGLHDRPYWWEAAPRPDALDLPLPPSADVVVIGSGFTGLSAALTLLRRGRKVLVLDKDVSGYGASTRNGGQIGSGNQKFRVKTLVALRGQAKAEAMLREGLAMLEFIATLVETERIDCHFVRCGRFRGAMQPEHYEAMARDLDDLRAVTGVESVMVPRAEQHREIGTDLFHGGSVLPADASLHPGLYHRGLQARVEDAGGLVLGRTPVIAVSPEGSAFTVATSRGPVRCRNVIVATNGYTDRSLPELRRRIVPIGSAIIATDVIDEPVFARLIPAGRVYGNTNRVFYYFRAAPGERRILWGGRAARLPAEHSPARYAHLARDLLSVFPELGSVRVTHGWEGRIGYTYDEVPHLGQTSAGVHYALGYCGTGVSRSTYFGHKIGLQVAGAPEGRTAFDDLPFPAYPFRAAAVAAVPVIEAVYRFRDRHNV